MIQINLIKRLRINKEMTQAQLAAACGVTQGAVALWEKGKCFPTARKIMSVARALDCDANLLLQMAEEKDRVGA